MLTPLKRLWRWFVGPLRFDDHVCPACWQHRVRAERWQLAAGDRRIVSLRCAACGHSDRRVVTQAQARRFERKEMTAWADAFIAALRSDLIDVGDFERSAFR